MAKEQNSKNNALNSLDALVANTCFCKLKAVCPDKNSADCLRHNNIYNDFMQQRNPQAKGD